MNDGGPAFPRAACDGNSFYNPPQEGLSLLDYFAAKAFERMVQAHIDDGNMTKAEIAAESYSYAAAMLAERERRKGVKDAE